jgi:hypothetical protein
MVWIEIKGQVFCLPSSITDRDFAQVFLSSGEALVWLRSQTGDADDLFFETYTVL